MLNTVRTVIANTVECSALAGCSKHHTYTNIRPPLHCPGHRLSYNQPILISEETGKFKCLDIHPVTKGKSESRESDFHPLLLTTILCSYYSWKCILFRKVSIFTEKKQKEKNPQVLNK